MATIATIRPDLLKVSDKVKPISLNEPSLHSDAEKTRKTRRGMITIS